MQLLENHDERRTEKLHIFLSGKTPGITDFSTGEHRENAVTKEWKLNKIQCETAKKVFKEQTQKI